ncbi:hypothetical protein ACFX5D_04130 [Flavobacterium sp. LB3P45]|uniref:LPXTG-motif cell wall anchor domain-containing protein n=1 Tax=Flavobacterium fructosi TaxID=3230416 RepID=A0ABW6HJE8_9FLAO
MIYINEGEIGLGKAKILKKIKLKKIVKQVSIKNAVKAVKFAAPIAAGFIPVGGGVASKLTSKVLNSKAGNLVKKVSKSKVAKKVVKLSKTQAGKLVVNQAKAVAQPKIEAIKSMTAATFSKTEPLGDLTPVKQTSPVAKVVTPVNKTATAYVTEEQSDNTEPVGELTPVKQTSGFANELRNIKVDDLDVNPPAKKDNTVLYVGGAVALGAIAYLATKKSK